MQGTLPGQIEVFPKKKCNQCGVEFEENEYYLDQTKHLLDGVVQGNQAAFLKLDDTLKRMLTAMQLSLCLNILEHPQQNGFSYVPDFGYAVDHYLGYLKIWEDKVNAFNEVKNKTV